MARAIPPDRFAQLIDAATKTFITSGYRRTQMADIAEALGVAKGTIYGYVESKEALFEAAVRYADRHLPPPDVGELPLKTPAKGKTVAYIRERIAAEAGEMLLLRAAGGGAPGKDTKEELRAIFADLYRRIARNR